MGSVQHDNFKSWARFQDEELKDRGPRGDGYSAWDWMTDSLGAAFHNADAYVTNNQIVGKELRTDGQVHSAYDKMHELLDQMRVLRDKQRADPTYGEKKNPLSFEDKVINSAWTKMLDGKIEY